MLDDLKRRIGNIETADIYLSDAKALAESYIGRDVVDIDESLLPKGLKAGIVRLGVILYNREGIEGESTRSGGGITRQMEAIPMEIITMLKPYRRFKVIE